jgi:large subunit ribosomal protein L19
MNVQRLQALRRAQQYHLLPIKPGMMVEIHEKIGEGNNQRIWKFKWLVIKVKKPNHADGTFTLRGKTSGHTIEKIYPLSFVNFDHVYLLDVYKVARAKLYYIREKIGKDAKMKSLITAEQRGIDLLALAKENLAAELPGNSRNCWWYPDRWSNSWCNCWRKWNTGCCRRDSNFRMQKNRWFKK